MFISVIGSRGSGKTSVLQYLVSIGFTQLHLDPFMETGGENQSLKSGPHVKSSNKHLSFLSMNFSPVSSPVTSFTTLSKLSDRLSFPTPQLMLHFVTQNWQDTFVTEDLTLKDDIEIFMLRPFFMLLRIDAPLFQRFQRLGWDSLEEFVQDDDRVKFGSQDSMYALSDWVTVDIANNFQSLPELHSHIDSINFINPDHLRPNWDHYFMTLASLASRRSNCMKRRVGALLVRDRRIVATGYNGTPRGVTNCNAGGCQRCNRDQPELDCVCLHAEENALLEAGRERVGNGSILYCNTCPCLKCTIKVIQSGVAEVVYNLSYKMDTASADLMKEAGIRLRRYNPKSTRYFLGTSTDGNTLTSFISDEDDNEPPT